MSRRQRHRARNLAELRAAAIELVEAADFAVGHAGDVFAPAMVAAMDQGGRSSVALMTRQAEQLDRVEATLGDPLPRVVAGTYPLMLAASERRDMTMCRHLADVSGLARHHNIDLTNGTVACDECWADVQVVALALTLLMQPNCDLCLVEPGDGLVLYPVGLVTFSAVLCNQCRDENAEVAE